MKKKTKRIITILLLVICFVTLLFLRDKEFYYSLKETIVNEIKELGKKLNKNNKEVLTDKFMVLFLDVGQAECILIKSDNEYMLIDAGNNVDGEKIVKYFKELGIKEFKYVFGTHAHEDHIGGMDDIINNFKIKNFYMPDVVTPTETFYSTLEALENKNIKFQTPIIDEKLSLGEATIDVIFVGDNEEDLNETSIILKVTYKNVSFLFTGDTTSNIENLLLDKNLESTVLKVAHHGSKYSNSVEFLNKVKPKYAVISCETDNDYYHPHIAVLKRLEKLNTTIYRTDLLGTIIVISDGDNIEFKNIKTDTNGVENEETRKIRGW